MNKIRISVPILICGFSALLILLSARQAFAAKYYVKNGGSDTLNGLSDATAWGTISKVQATVKSGDTVYFRSEDIWTSPTPPVLTATAGVTYDGTTYGSGARATLRSTGNAITHPNYSTVKIEGSDVIFRGFDVDANHFRTGGIYVGYLSSADITNITIDNCTIHGTGGISGDWNYGVQVGNKNGHIIRSTSITNCTVYDCFHEGIAIYAGWANADNRNDTVLVRGCTVYNTGTIGSGGAGILICNDSRNVTVEFSNLYNNDWGIWVRTSPSYEGYVNYGPQNMNVRYNLIHDNNYFGICVVNPRNLVESGSFYSNILYGNGKAGYGNTADVYIGDSSNSSDYPGCVFSMYNNTCFPTPNPGSNLAACVAIGYFGTINSGVFNLKNNIIYSGNYRALVNKSGNLLAHSNNLIYRSSSAFQPHVSSGGAEYDRAGVLTWEGSAQNSDPNFAGGALPSGFSGSYGYNMMPNTNYFAVRFGNVIDSGAFLGSPYNGCINGAGIAAPISRPQGEGYDIGAYEHVDAAPPSAPQNLRIE